MLESVMEGVVSMGKGWCQTTTTARGLLRVHGRFPPGRAMKGAARLPSRFHAFLIALPSLNRLLASGVEKA